MIGQHQHQEREGEHDVDEPHEQRVDDPAEIAGDGADRACRSGTGRRTPKTRDLQVDAGAPDDARQDVAAEIVGAEGMLQARAAAAAPAGPARSGRRAPPAALPAPAARSAASRPPPAHERSAAGRARDSGGWRRARTASALTASPAGRRRRSGCRRRSSPAPWPAGEDQRHALHHQVVAREDRPDQQLARCREARRRSRRPPCRRSASRR